MVANPKRDANEMMRDGLRDREDEPIAFFCECRSERCYQAVWLTGAAYDRARADPTWAALVADHLAEGGSDADERAQNIRELRAIGYLDGE